MTLEPIEHLWLSSWRYILFIHREPPRWEEERPQMGSQNLTTELPDTHTVSSGAGFHVYWDLIGQVGLVPGFAQRREITVVFWCHCSQSVVLTLWDYWNRRSLSLIFEQFMFVFLMALWTRLRHLSICVKNNDGAFTEHQITLGQVTSRPLGFKMSPSWLSW